MDEARLEEIRQQAKLREQQDEERRLRRIEANLQLQKQEREAQDEARQAAVPPTKEQHYAHLPHPFYAGIR